MAIPLKAQFSNLIGYILCMYENHFASRIAIILMVYFFRVVFVAVYYKNIWQSQSFPFVRVKP